MISVIAAQAIFSATFLFGKLALQYVKPLFLTGFRTLLGSFILMLFYLSYGRYRIPLTFSWKLIGQIIIIGFFYNFLAVAARFWALQYVPIAKASFIYNISPFLTVILSALFFRQRLTLLKIVGLIIGLLGFAPVFLNMSAGEIALQHFGIFSTAELALISASIASVIGNMLFKHVIEQKKCHFLFVSAGGMFVGSFFNFLSSYMYEIWDPIPVTNMKLFLFWAVVLTLCTNVIAYSVYGKLLKKYTASIMSFAGMLVPIYTSIAGILFLHEPFQWYVIYSLIIVTVGLSIFYWQELRLGYVHESNG